MNLKFYLRGLGIGIVVTAVIMLILSAKNTKSMTDDQIKERAVQLGMVEGHEVLTDIDSGNKSADEAEQPAGGDTSADAVVPTENPNALPETEATESPEEVSENPESEPTIEPTEEPLVTPTPEPAPTEEPTPEPTEAPLVTPIPDNGSNSVNFTVNSGESSYTVAKNLESMGLVESASAFDTYLCEKGYDTKIHAGSFSFSEGMTEEEIASKLVLK